MSIKWWEKTVEYKFVHLLFTKKKLFLAPLDGKEESAGDLILGGEKWLLIEFKKNKAAILDEIQKFDNFEDTKRRFSKRDKHHHLVYGFCSNKLGLKGPELMLASQTYFSSVPNQLPQLLSSGIDLEEFKKYLKDFTNEKKSVSSDGGVSPEAFELVAGVSSAGEIVECKTMKEFCIEHALDLKQKKGVVCNLT